MNNKHRILIIDDHKLIIEGYKSIINLYFPDEEFKIESAYDCDSAMEKIKKSKFDLIILDISIPSSKINPKMISGEELGVWIKIRNPNIKIIAITYYADNYRINSILKNINPNSFLLKNEMSVKDLPNCIKAILDDDDIPYYSNTISKFIRKKVSRSMQLDEFDIQILLEISRGTRNSELENFIGLSKIAITKRKKRLKQYFDIDYGTDRDLILHAKKNMYI